jgi:hypothetical protein
MLSLAVWVLVDLVVEEPDPRRVLHVCLLVCRTSPAWKGDLLSGVRRRASVG